MGLIQAALSSVSGTLANQWKEFIYADAISDDVLMTRGHKRLSGAHPGSNTKGDDNIISNGSVIAVADGQAMLIVEQGKVVEFCAEPGEFVWDSSTEPSIFAGNLGDSIKETFLNIGRRVGFGGTTGKDQRVYYINTRELMGNKYGTANPVPFRVVDANIGLDTDISVRCFGEYSYRIMDPILFYTNVCANVSDVFTRDRIDSQLKTELLTALQPAFAKISGMGIRYSAVMGHTLEMADALNEQLSEKWGKLRGLEIVSFGISSLTALPEDEERIKKLQMNATMRDASMRDAQVAAAAAEAMVAAAKNEGSGPAMAFMGMNMAGQVGQGFMSGQNAAPNPMQSQYPTAAGGGFAQPAPAAPAAPAGDSWVCPSCGQANNGKFCSNCGTARPEKMVPKHCPNCGNALDPSLPAKFCPNCGFNLQ